MNNVLLVSGMNRGCDLLDNGGGEVGRLGSALDSLAEHAAIDVLHRKKGLPLVLADFIDLHDIRMPQRRDGFSLLQKTGAVLLVGVAPREDHFQRHDPVQSQLPRLVNNAHAAAAECIQDLVTGDFQVEDVQFQVRRADLLLHGAPGETSVENGIALRSRLKLHTRIFILADRSLIGSREACSQRGKTVDVLVEFGELAVLAAQRYLNSDEAQPIFRSGPYAFELRVKVLDRYSLAF